MFRKLLKEYKTIVDKRLAVFFDEKIKEVEKESNELVKLLKSLKEVGMGGKRLRGFLFMVGYGLGKKEQELDWEMMADEVWNGGLALELFHLGLLIQDDVMDGDEERRGVRAIHVRYEDSHYGEAMANLGADICFGWAIELLSGWGKEVMREWGRYFERVGWGQVLDIVQTQKKINKLDDYKKVVRLKTAEYTGEMPLVLGWLAAGREREEGKDLFKFGERWGEMFQWRDDWLDGDGLVEWLGRENLKAKLEKEELILKEKVGELDLNSWWQELLKEMVEELR